MVFVQLDGVFDTGEGEISSSAATASYDFACADEVGADEEAADTRCDEALEVLTSKRLVDGGFPAEKKHYQVTNPLLSGYSLVDWGGTSLKRMNPFVTVEALSLLSR